MSRFNEVTFSAMVNFSSSGREACSSSTFFFAVRLIFTQSSMKALLKHSQNNYDQWIGLDIYAHGWWNSRTKSMGGSFIRACGSIVLGGQERLDSTAPTVPDHYYILHLHSTIYPTWISDNLLASLVHIMKGNKKG